MSNQTVPYVDPGLSHKRWKTVGGKPHVDDDLNIPKHSLPDPCHSFMGRFSFSRRDSQSQAPADVRAPEKDDGIV